MSKLLMMERDGLGPARGSLRTEGRGSDGPYQEGSTMLEGLSARLQTDNSPWSS